MRAIHQVLLPAILLLAGCGADEFQDLQDFVKNSGADMRGKIEAPPEVKPYEPFNYDNSAGLADPFKPRIQARAKDKSEGSGANQPNLDRHKEELEEFPLESLKMVGFLYIHKTAHAQIIGPDGKIHNVKIGNYMGQNFGQITSITETEIKLKEMVQDSAGDWSERVSSLQLVD
jgi:type IV pilus assembly protein PilP